MKATNCHGVPSGPLGLDTPVPLHPMNDIERVSVQDANRAGLVAGDVGLDDDRPDVRVRRGKLGCALSSFSGVSQPRASRRPVTSPAAGPLSAGAARPGRAAFTVGIIRRRCSAGPRKFADVTGNSHRDPIVNLLRLLRVPRPRVCHGYRN
ncbi:hypothetical protein EVAR_7732_1 [Eumeta japonica]|uniref:Uncharacterized protein n=1 Tax=Eumeta variegata TaxID=151549 RepID=A0A4C1TLX8_EUMVA|nr:hypothetical protein EVAR_7732_1 [Eumeta japonica]